MTAWSSAFRRSSIAPSLFVVSAAFTKPVEKWLKGEDLPIGRRGGVFQSWTTGWALEDGGVTFIDPEGFNSLPYGYRVVGWGALRRLCRELDLDPPNRPLFGEKVYSAAKTDPGAAARAELLTAYHSGPTMRWVIRRLMGDGGLGPKRDEYAPGSEAWGDLGFSVGAQKLLQDSMEATQAASHARRLELRLLPDVATTAPYYGISASDAHRVLDLRRAGESAVDEWESIGVPAPAALAAMEGGMSLADARAWMELGAAPEVYLLSSIAESRVRPEQAAPYVALGIEPLLAYRLAATETPVNHVSRMMVQSADPMAAVRALVFGYPDLKSNSAGRR